MHLNDVIRIIHFLGIKIYWVVQTLSMLTKSKFDISVQQNVNPKLKKVDLGKFGGFFQIVKKILGF